MGLVEFVGIMGVWIDGVVLVSVKWRGIWIEGEVIIMETSVIGPTVVIGHLILIGDFKERGEIHINPLRGRIVLGIVDLRGELYVGRVVETLLLHWWYFF